MTKTGISILQASRTYQIPFSTLRGWVKKGILPPIGKQGKSLLLDPSQLQEIANVYYTRRGKGKRVFDREGNPNKINMS